MFPRTETQIPLAQAHEGIAGSQNAFGQLEKAQSQVCQGRLPFLSSIQKDIHASTKQHRYRREDLLSAQVVDQVDGKFIACIIDDRSSVDSGDHRELGLPFKRSLVLIDQHAADERIRVERFLEPLCLGYMNDSAQTRSLVPEKAILLTSYETTRLADNANLRHFLARWGFGISRLAQEDEARENDYAQVWISRVPDVVGDKVSQNFFPPYVQSASLLPFLLEMLSSFLVAVISFTNTIDASGCFSSCLVTNYEI